MSVYYHGSRTHAPIGVLNHFGSFFAAEQRFETTFVTRFGFAALDSKTDQIIYLDKRTSQPIGSQDVASFCQDFVDSMKTANIYEVCLNIRNPLKIKDLWDDDPIGSAGLPMFSDTQGLTPKQRIELTKLFAPFQGILMPSDISHRITNNGMKAMERSLNSDPIYKNELAKRRARLGKDGLKTDKKFELTWLHYTKELCSWARRQGFDGFVYKNECEDGSANVLVNFDAKQVKIESTWQFDVERYQELMADIVRKRFSEIAKSSTMIDVFMPELGQEKYWIKTLNAPSNG